MVSGSDHRLTDLSGILNVEFINSGGSVVQSVKLSLSSGTAHGDFALPDTLAAGSYRLRAYTNYMRNAGPDYFFDKTLDVINTVGIGSIAKSSAGLLNGKPDVQFFPEGGLLVNGITSKIAFKAVSPNGLGVDVSGIITDNNGRQVASFSSSHLGMGIFELTPKAGFNYIARVSINGVESAFALPLAANSGYIFSVSGVDKNEFKLSVTASGNVRPVVNNRLLIVAQSNGRVCYSAYLNPVPAAFHASVPKNSLPAGIIQFTLFSSSGEPLNERLVFNEDDSPLNLKLTSDQASYSVRQQVRLNLEAYGNSNKPVSGNFSVAVTDETKVPANQDMENNIMANLLLTSDLKGYIEQPAYYFNNVNDNTRKDLDVLMLTQGYHRFEWKQVLAENIPAMRYQPEHTLKLSGTVLTPAGKPVANGKVKLFDLDSIQFTRDTVTDVNGRFAFNNLSFDDSVRFIIQARNERNKKDVIIKIDKDHPEAIPEKARPIMNVSADSTLSVYAKNALLFFNRQRQSGTGNHVYTLKEVTIRDKKALVEHSANLNGAGNADQIILSREFQYLGCIRLADCLQGKVLGVVFRNGIPYSTRSFGPMQVIIDGVYVSGDYLNEINYNDVQAIEVLRNGGLTAIYGGYGANGVFLVTTKTGGEHDYPQPIFGRGITTSYPKGYYKAREFYSPRYYRPETNKKLADVRTTIYWGYDLKTGKDGKASFQYFNAGSKGRYSVVIEGVGTDGTFGRLVYHYQVE